MKREQILYRKAIVAHLSNYLVEMYLNSERPDRCIEAPDMPRAQSEVPREDIEAFVQALHVEELLLEAKLQEAMGTKLLGTAEGKE